MKPHDLHRKQTIDKYFLRGRILKYKLRLEDIKRSTKEFAIDNILEEGTHWRSYCIRVLGKRYKGVAYVKRFNKKLTESGSYDFKQEVLTLARCNHVNVISMLGYCDEENENIIVYKCVPNRLLYDYLYNNQDHTPRLTIKQRLDICRGVAHGLYYIHLRNIIHANLATSKIFLDHDLVPSIISGMDMSFFIDSEGSLNRNVHYKNGREGYEAPECYEPGYKPSKQADVYAFGVLLLEVLCEKPPWMSLAMLALEFAMKGELHEIRHEPVEMSIYGRCMRECNKLIKECLNFNRSERPSMKQVMNRLEFATLQNNIRNSNVNSQQSSQSHNRSSSSAYCQSFTISEIEEATNKFSNTNKLGEGGYGTVYSANFFCAKYEGVAAVKRLTKKTEKGVEGYKKELELVTACNHVNIISLIGYCDEQEERILLYELMPNGSLHDYLYTLKDPVDRLTIEQRLEICIGVAKGLDYLHSRKPEFIIHSDLKTDNILLDQKLVPKISDFGLSRTRVAGPLASKQTTKNVHGTLGYIAPECYELNYKLSRKADVYAYGVVLLEVICEKRAWDDLIIVALQVIKEGKLPDFTPDYVSRHISTACLRAIADLITECLYINPNKRPDMKEVVTRIEEALILEKKYSNDHLLPFTDPKIFSSCSDRAVLYHIRESNLLPQKHIKCLDEDIPYPWFLANYEKRVDERNVLLDPSFTKQLKKIYAWREYSLPQLFIGGEHIGGMLKLQELYKDGTLQAMFAKLPNRDYPSRCEKCDNMRFVPCLNNSCVAKRVKKCPNSDCKECNEKGLIQCPICCFWKSDYQS